MTIRPPGIIERAFQLALASANVEEIRIQLRKEGYSNVDGHLTGRQIRADLVKMMRRGNRDEDASHQVSTDAPSAGGTRHR
jgi:hypothetical protein